MGNQSEGTRPECQGRVVKHDSTRLGVTLLVTRSWKGPESPREGAGEAAWGVGPSGPCRKVFTHHHESIFNMLKTYVPEKFLQEADCEMEHT